MKKSKRYKKRPLSNIPSVPKKTDDDGARYIGGKINRLLALSRKARFVQNPLASEFFRKFQNDDDDFKVSFHYNLTEKFFSYLYWKTKYYEPVNISFSGIQRGGKSSAAISTALDISYLTGVPFPADCSHIYQNQSLFLRNMPNLKERGAYVIDEQTQQLAQIGSFAEDFELGDFNHITAKRGISTIWVCPEFVNRSNEYLLKVVGIDRRLMLTKALIMDLKNSEDNFYRIFGYVIFEHYDDSVTRITPQDLIKMPDTALNPRQLIRKKYEINKDKFIEQISARFSSSRVEMRINDALKLSTDSLFKACKNKTDRKIVARATLPAGYTENELDEICKLGGNPVILTGILERYKTRGVLGAITGENIKIPPKKKMAAKLKNEDDDEI